jgi:hypothetical protein
VICAATAVDGVDTADAAVRTRERGAGRVVDFDVVVF